VASRRTVLSAFLAEATLFGAAGAAIAIPLGRMLAAGAVRLLGATVNGLYISSRPGSLELSASRVLLALLVGVGIAIVSAFAPAREASMVSYPSDGNHGARPARIRSTRRTQARRDHCSRTW